MKKFTLVSSMAAGLSLLLARGALAAVNPAAPNPYPTRESKVLADFESAAMVTSDPNGTGGNLASINNDPQFVAEGSKSLAALSPQGQVTLLVAAIYPLMVSWIPRSAQQDA